MRAEQASFDKAISAVQQQAEATKQQAHSYQETFHSPSVLVQIGLLGVGVLYSFFAALQWTAIKRQAQLVVMMERPWLMVIPTGCDTEPKNAPPTARRAITLRYKVVNAGRTPAWLTGTCGTALKASSSTLPAKPQYPSDITTALTPKPPNETFGESIYRIFEPDEYAALCEGKIDFITYGLMTYRSSLQSNGVVSRVLGWLGVPSAKTEHVTRYCFCLTKGPAGPLAMCFCGPPAYNEYT